MPSQQLSSHDEESAEEDKDGRFVNCWTSVSDEIKKREILTYYNINNITLYPCLLVKGQRHKGCIQGMPNPGSLLFITRRWQR
jgi:hypothetical protein